MGAGRVALVGVPYDAASSFRRGAAHAPGRIREMLRSPAGNEWSETGVAMSRVLVDRGDLSMSRDINESIERGIADILRSGAKPLILGGDHAVSYGAVRAVARRHERLTVLQLDAHPDLYDEFEGNRFSHACTFARIVEDRLAARLVQVGIRAATAHQLEQAARFGVDMIDMRRWLRGDRLDVAAPVYLSLDLDVIDPAHAPGVSHPEPGGLSVREVIALIHGVGADLVGADVVEYNPDADVGDATARVAAKLVKELAGVMGG
jgi:agmatinase